MWRFETSLLKNGLLNPKITNKIKLILAIIRIKENENEKK